MKVYNNNQLYKSPAGDQLWNSGRQNWIFGRIGDQEGAISDPVKTYNVELIHHQSYGTPSVQHQILLRVQASSRFLQRITKYLR